LEKNGKTHIQSMKCTVRGKLFCFTYCRESPSQREAEWLNATSDSDDYTLGDLNLDPNDSNQKKKIATICKPRKKALLNETTTKYYKQLDHILGEEKEELSVFTTAFTNFISDHKSIVLRISLSNSDFKEDWRLVRFIYVALLLSYSGGKRKGAWAWH